MKKRIAFGAFMALIIYLLGSFVSADFNIASWGYEGRAICAIVMFVVGILSAANPFMED